MNVTSKLTTLTLAALGVALVASTAIAGPRGDRMGMGGEGQGMAMNFAAMDADNDGKVTPAEIEAFRTAKLTAADTDGDGFLSAEELQAMVLAQMQERANVRAAQMIERQDTDGDGKLSMAEMTPPTPQQRMFSRLDTDKDGALSEAELAAAKGGKHERRGDKRGHHGDKVGKRGMQNN